MEKSCQLCGNKFNTIKYGEARKFCFDCSPPGDRASAITNLRRKSKEIGVQRLGGKCLKCGISKEYLLEFHHRNPEEKEDTLATIAKNYNFELYFSELEKCDLLCANCHREFHYLNTRYKINYQDYLSNSQFESDL